jgi:sulfite exporter TauE/SafE
LDLFNTYSFLPFAAIIVGLSGSLHCIGMCGGLVIACSKNQKRSLVSYHIGRLLGYLLLGVVAGMIGEVFSLGVMPKEFTLLPALAIGITLVFWGYRGLKGKKATSQPPQFLAKIHSKILNVLLKIKIVEPSFFFGSLSILLPCGLLYGVVLVAVTTGNVFTGALVLFFFWAGTLPSLTLAPKYFYELLDKLFLRSPKAMPLTLMVFGLSTISYRLYQYFTFTPGGSCH